MNLPEFKAWFEGFTENLDGAPTKAQWKKIEKKVEGLVEEPTPWPIFVDRYIRPRAIWWHETPYHWVSSSNVFSNTAKTPPAQWVSSSNNGLQAAISSSGDEGSEGISSSGDAWRHLGRMEATA